MFNKAGTLLYIGKAKDLQKRLSSYFNKAQDTKTQTLVSQIEDIEYTITHTELEALILEHNLIKKHKPRYNVLLKDDKSYPFIAITVKQDYPRMDIHRGRKNKQDKYFGPYPNAYAARTSLHLLQKLFKIRSCRDTFFENRTRPCLQYQIKRCTAPCVGFIQPEQYQQDVNNAIAFLQGRSQEVLDVLIEKMDHAAHALQYEEAAVYRDQIHTLQHLVQKQYVSKDYGFADVCVAVTKQDQACVTQIFVRQGQVIGHKNYFFKHNPWQGESNLLSDFVGQFYLVRAQSEMPGEIILNHRIADKTVIEEALTEKAQKQVKMLTQVRKEKQQWLNLAEKNALEALDRHLASRSTLDARFETLQDQLKIPTINRIECFDISHNQGGETVGACVVFNREGPFTQDYRRFNLKLSVGGDDYAAMEQTLFKYYEKRKLQDAVLPDLILIDGGKGQLNRAHQVMEELQLTDIPLIGVSKGPARKPGQEQLWRVGVTGSMRLPADSPGLHLIQQVRDESHRFAIVGHRKKAQKVINTSSLEQIPGIGPKKRQALLKYFGGLQGVAKAEVEAIAKVPGMSKELAQKVYDALHGEM